MLQMENAGVLMPNGGSLEAGMGMAMRLIVAESRVAQRGLALLYPEDKVVCVGDALHGIRVTEIVVKTFIPKTPHKREQEAQWWEHARCRVEPQ